MTSVAFSMTDLKRNYDLWRTANETADWQIRMLIRESEMSAHRGCVYAVLVSFEF